MSETENIFSKNDKQFLSNSDLKIVLLGDSAVGKSKLLQRFLLDDYKPRQVSTFALNVFRYETIYNDKSLKIDFWDTAGMLYIFTFIYNVLIKILFLKKARKFNFFLFCLKIIYIYMCILYDIKRFNSMHPSYYYRAHACILVFDVTRKLS